MTKLDEIEKAIADLPPDDMAKFRNWFDEFDARLWDQQLEQDIKNGKLDDLARQALIDHHSGQTKEL